MLVNRSVKYNVIVIIMIMMILLVASMLRKCLFPTVNCYAKVRFSNFKESKKSEFSSVYLAHYFVHAGITTEQNKILTTINFIVMYNNVNTMIFPAVTM